jgi:5-methylcytosine-specific restriction protein A
MISDELGSNVPEVKAYRQAFLAIRDELTDNQRRLLQIHYAAPKHTIEPVVLAERVGYPSYSAVNLQYGLLAKRACNALGLQLRFHIQALIIYIYPDTNQGESPKWVMRPQVAQALQELGWVAVPASRPFEVVSDEGFKENQVHQIIRSLLPQEGKRRLCLEMFVEVINHANSCGGDKWGVYCEPNKVRLLVGNLIVFTIEKGNIWLALDKESIEASDETERLLLEVNEWQWDKDDYPMYSQVSSRNGYYTPSENHPEIWPVIRSLHFEFVSKVAQKYRKLRMTSQAKHSSVLLSYLRSETKQLVPDPIYEQTEKGGDFTSPDEILAEHSYETDVRKPPDNRRRGQFRVGWEDATVREHVYTDKTLARLTWRNLGYRLGTRFGKRHPDEIEQVYERFAQHYSEQSDEFVLPEEILDDVTFYEGGKQRITVNAYERSSKARAACIAHYGMCCQVCGFNFREQYGEIGRGIIHVHHRKPLSDIGEEYEIDPIQDLIPVCPNCHTIIHKRNPPYTVGEVKDFLRLAGEADN